MYVYICFTFLAKNFSGVCLYIYIGHQDVKAAREFIHFIAESVREKCAVILGSSKFMSVLTDGSQARKTGSDREMVLIRTERAGE